MSAQDVVEKIDALLSDDKNFTTRAGLHFTLEVLKDAIDVNDKAMAQISAFQDQQKETDRRLKNVEQWQIDFMIQRTKEKEKDETERTKWRWAILSPSIGLAIAEIAYVINWLFKLVVAALAHG